MSIKQIGMGWLVLETSGTAQIAVRNVPISCSPRLLLVHQATGCTGSLEVRAASALCSPVSLGAAVRLWSPREGFPSSGYCLSVSALRLLIPVYLLIEVILPGGMFPVRPSAEHGY